MNPLPVPTDVLSSRLGAAPARVWERVCNTGFIAHYLGASLPPADLATRPLDAPPLQGTSQAGQPLKLHGEVPHVEVSPALIVWNWWPPETGNGVGLTLYGSGALPS